MIKWMQELGLIIKECTRQNNLKEPNYLSRIYPSKSFHTNFEKQRSEDNEGNSNEEEENKEATEQEL